MKHLVYFLVIGATMIVLAEVLPGFYVESFTAALIAAVVLAIVNTLLRPILFLLTLPFTIITLGLFLLVLNATMVWLTAQLVPGLEIDGPLTTLLASIVLSLVGMVWKSATKDDKKKNKS